MLCSAILVCLVNLVFLGLPRSLLVLPKEMEGSPTSQDTFPSRWRGKIKPLGQSEILLLMLPSWPIVSLWGRGVLGLWDKDTAQQDHL